MSSLNSSAINLPKTSFPKINKTIDSEHLEIFHAIDNLYNACKKHWITENSLFKIGLDRMPARHKNAIPELKDHEKEHVSLLKQIVEMKKHIKHHIETQDVPHFHWVH